MNPVGIYFAFWEKEWDCDYEYYIDKVKRLGFDVLEVAAGSLPKLTPAERIKIAKKARDAGLELTYCIGLAPEYDLASEDASVRENGIRYVKNLLTCIHEMEGRLLGGILYSCWPGRTVDYEYKQRARERSAASVKEIAQQAEQLGILYCLEVVNRFEQYLLNTAAEGKAFVEEVNSPNVKLLLDSFHMNIEEDSFAEAIHTAGEALGHFHIGECNRKTPGLGRMDFDTIAAALHEVNYKGNVVMEPFIRPGGQVGRDIKIYRDQSGGADEVQMDKMAKESLALIRKKLSQNKS